MSVNFSYSRFPHDFIRKGYSAKLGPYCTAIYLCLLYHKNHKTGECFPAESTIGMELGISRNSVRKYIKPLLDFKIVDRKKEKSRNGRTLYHYIINKPSKWKSLCNNQCSPHEHISNPDVRLVTDRCSPDAISDVHEVHTNNKNLTRRINKKDKDLISEKDNDQLVEERNKEMDKLTGVNVPLREKMLKAYVLKTPG